MSVRIVAINSGRGGATISYYLPGRKPQYGATRWERYESLRVKGFSKYEARELSKIRIGDALDVVEEMARTRQRLLNKATKEGWSRYQYYVKVRAFYRRNNLTSILRPDGTRVAKKAGRADVFVWFHRQEKKMARQRGWRKDDPSAPSRRPKKKTEPRKGPRKGDIKAQKKRASQRALAHKLGFEFAGHILAPEMRRKAVFGSGGLVETGRKHPERQDEMREKAKRLGYKGRLVF